MPRWRYRQHGLTGRGPCLQVADVGPDTPPAANGPRRGHGRPWLPPWTARAPSASPHPPRVDGRRSRPGGDGRWHGSTMRWPVPTHRGVAADGRTWP